MEYVKKVNIKNRRLYICGSRVILDNFISDYLKIKEELLEDISAYYLSYKPPNNTLKPVYLVILEAEGYFKKGKGAKYLEIASTNHNNDVLKKYEHFWLKVNSYIKVGTSICSNDFMKIKIETDDKLPLNKLLNFNLLTISIKVIYEQCGKFYPQLFVDSCLYEDNV